MAKKLFSKTFLIFFAILFHFYSNPYAECLWPAMRMSLILTFKCRCVPAL